MRTLRVWVAAFGIAMIAACTDEPTSPPSGDQLEAKRAPTGETIDMAAVDNLARGVALAMNDAGIRALVRDAMRASEVTEHKLVLQDFVRTPAGQRLIDASASALGQRASALHAQITRLPALDFYVPYREHRLTWTGSAELVVAPHVRRTTPTYGFAVSGSREVLDLRAGAIPLPTLLVLQLAERKDRRIRPQAARPGLVIQDPDDGEETGVLVTIDASGQETIVDLATVATSGPPVRTNQICTPDTCSGGGGPIDPDIRPLYLKSIITRGVCDNGLCGEGNEFEFRAQAGNAIRTLWKTGIGSSVTRWYLQCVSGDSGDNCGYIGAESPAIYDMTVAVKETDGITMDDLWELMTPSGYHGPIVLPWGSLPNQSFPLREMSAGEDITNLSRLAVSFTW